MIEPVSLAVWTKNFSKLFSIEIFTRFFYYTFYHTKKLLYHTADIILRGVDHVILARVADFEDSIDFKVTKHLFYILIG